MATYFAIAIPTLMALAAVGVVLSLKVARRRGTLVDTSGVAHAVPARPLSDDDAKRMMQRYFWSAGVIVAVLVIVGLALAAG